MNWCFFGIPGRLQTVVGKGLGRTQLLAMAALFLTGIAQTSVSFATLLSNDGTPAGETTPGGLTPFADWNRGAVKSVYGLWDTFAATSGAAPDVGSYVDGLSPGPKVNETTGQSFITSGGNIYSFAVPTKFDVPIPAHNLGSGWYTRVVAQIDTLGTILDPATVKLNFNNGTTDVSLSPIVQELLFDQAITGGFGGADEERLFVFDVYDSANSAWFNPASLSLHFEASGSSMSLDRLAIDTFTKDSPLSAVPEPGSLLLLSLGAVGASAYYVTRRRAVARAS